MSAILYKYFFIMSDFVAYAVGEQEIPVNGIKCTVK